jgi:hypothetical protein
VSGLLNDQIKWSRSCISMIGRTWLLMATSVAMFACGSTQEPVMTTNSDAADSDAFGNDSRSPDETCIGNCNGVDCGNDGCGGSCGTCQIARACSDDRVCVAVPCASSKDCPSGSVCHSAEGLCVDCVNDEDCPQEERCTGAHACQPVVGCASDKDCTLLGLLCDKEQGLCVDCLLASHCLPEEYCSLQSCVPDECLGLTAVCEGDVVLRCLEDGSRWEEEKICSEVEYCKDGYCEEYVCTPDAIWCDEQVRKECDATGRTVETTVDCAAQDQICLDGQCQSLQCEPGVTSCANSTSLSHCAEDGLSLEEESCPPEHYCESGICEGWKCVPEDPMCVDGTASSCKPDGSGPSLQGVDCEALGQTCVAGICAMCVPDCDGKQCGDDGCGGHCGECDAEQVCIGGKCPPSGSQCDDGNNIDWDGCTDGQLTEFQVNKKSAGYQGNPRVAAVGPDAYVVVWTSEFIDGSGLAAVAREMTTGTLAPSAEFQVNQSTTGDQHAADVAPAVNGDYAVAVVSATEQTAPRDLSVRFCNFGSGPTTPEILVESGSTGSHTAPSMAYLSNDTWVIVWETYIADAQVQTLQGRILSSGGEPEVPFVEVDDSVEGKPIGCHVAPLDGGGYGVSWRVSGANDVAGAFARLYSASGTPISDKLRFDDGPTTPKSAFLVPAANGVGLFAFWTTSVGVFGRELMPDGPQLGPTMTVFAGNSGNWSGLRAARMADGLTGVVWQGPGPSHDIFLQVVTDTGQNLQELLYINEFKTVNQTHPSITVDPAGSFLVTWQSDANQDGDSSGIFGRRVLPDGSWLYL